MPKGIYKRIIAEERFWLKVNKTETCWLWTKAHTEDGYGIFWYKNKNVRAHRFAYELLVDKIGNDLTIDHLCRIRNCVNPAHLEVVTMVENLRRGNGICSINAKKTHCKRGHAFIEGSYYKVGDYGRNCKACAKIKCQIRNKKRKEIRRLAKL